MAEDPASASPSRTPSSAPHRGAPPTAVRARTARRRVAAAAELSLSAHA
ncbi:MAG TPA: hypothetical protein VK497_02225 [Candidatus Saccharimonadales bacterium]|nr:hypothetical protein [Candidatus Saccharimonadales bacterium]